MAAIKVKLKKNHFFIAGICRQSAGNLDEPFDTVLEVRKRLKAENQTTLLIGYEMVTVQMLGNKAAQ